MYVLRFVQNIRKKNVKTGPITVQELKESENQLFKWSQFHLKPSVVDKKLIPSLDENGIIRAHGRLEHVRLLLQEMRNPVILPRDHPLVRLLLRHLHEKRGHCGYKSLIHEARRNHWIIGVRNMSKALTAKCITCRKLRKKPLDQLMGRIPSLRVAAGFPPFSNTAIDMFGPLHIKLNRKTLKEAQIVRHLLTSTQDRVNEFWKCWMTYFAPNLLPRNKWFRTRENVQVDDLVLEVDPNHKRSKWKLARVIATYPGNDGLVRKARIKTQDSEYDRPIHKLCLIATKDELNADRSR